MENVSRSITKSYKQLQLFWQLKSLVTTFPKFLTHCRDLETCERPSLDKHLFSIYYVAMASPVLKKDIYSNKQLYDTL